MVRPSERACGPAGGKTPDATLYSPIREMCEAGRTPDSENTMAAKNKTSKANLKAVAAADQARWSPARSATPSARRRHPTA